MSDWFSSVKSFTFSPSTACVSRSTWRPSVTPMRSSSCQTQNDLRPLSVPQIVPPVTCILGFPENAPFWGPCLSAGLLKSFFFFFFKFLLNWMWFKQPLTGVEKQGKLWIWYIVLVNYILPNKSPSACKGLRYNCLKESWLNWTFVFWKIKVLGAFFFYSCVHHSVLLM